MEQNFQSTKLPTVGATAGASIGGRNWANPSRITADDGSSATIAYISGGDHGAAIRGSSFGFQALPDSAVIDGVSVFIDGSNTGMYGTVAINAAGAVAKDLGTMSGTYGSSTDLWGLSEITPAQIAAITVTVDTGDVSGGDGFGDIDYLSVTVYWHIEMPQAEEDEVPTRFDYKVFASDGSYLGLLPKVTSKFGFAQDINSAGSSIVITCGKFVTNETTVTPLLTEAGDVITTESDLPILATETDLLVTTGDSDDYAIFKNANRIKAWMYNRYYPNGKLVFSGQVNRVEFKYGGADPTVKLTVFSDGVDLNNYITRGYPFSYTTEVSQTSQNSNTLIEAGYGDKGAGTWHTYGQSFITDTDQTTIGAISLMLAWGGDITVSVYDAPNGNLLGSVTKNFNHGAPAIEQFEFPSLIPVTPSTTYFFAIWVGEGNNLYMYYQNSDVYAGGQLYESSYSGGSGGGSFLPITGDMYFIVKSGIPTTTTTYSTDDPVSDMAHGILLDYNARGGLITERDFEATGLSLTYTFVVATILDALKKIIELCPSGYYMNIDLGTADIDILQISDTADFTVVRGRHITELNLALSIEQVKNYLLLSGGPTAGVNLYRDYTDAESTGNYGIRTATKSDNRITLSATADAVGDSFIEENANEIQETQLLLKDEYVDITQFVPGKTIGFRNFGNFIDNMVLQIVRREPNYSDGTVLLTLGKLPIRMNDEIQRINRDLLNEQTIANPSAPS